MRRVDQRGLNAGSPGLFEGGQFGFSASPPTDELAALPLNDLGNAMRLVRMAGGIILGDGTVNCEAAELLYVPETGWGGWNGQIWDFELGPRMAERLAHRVAQALGGQAQSMVSRGLSAREVWEFVRKAGDAGRLSAMVRVAEGYLQVGVDAFDRDPLRLSVRNGTLRFSREAGDGFNVERTPHDLRHRITRMADVDYDAKAECKLWRKSLEQWLPDECVREFVRRLMGYVLTGVTNEQVFVVLQGRGRDGKSTFVGVLRELMGGYADVADVRTFLDTGQRSGGDASPDLARLSGDCRLISVSEPPRGARLGEAMIKSFTGGAPILARRLHRDLFSFEPKPKVVMECNSRPKIRGDDDGIWRRLRLVMFTRQVPPAEVDRTLATRLAAERSGILNWLLEGLADWLSEGLNEPREIVAAMDDYRRSSSPFADWFEECIVVEQFVITPFSHLHGSYKDWCERNEVDRPMTSRAFADALTDRQIVKAGQDAHGRAKRSGAKLRSPSASYSTAPRTPATSHGA